MNWEEFKAIMQPRESGGDPNALYGYSNRAGGEFAGTDLTNMTLDELLAFSAPSGPYAQSVKSQIGRVATPMGLNQVVGTTLRDAIGGLGLSGQEKFSPDTQDTIGKWIYENQGPNAWASMTKEGRPDMINQLPQQAAAAAQPTSNDPMGSLSKSQRLMLAFGALKDAGMALQGKESNSFANTLTGVNEQQDQERKRVAAANVLKQQSDAQAFMMGLVTPEQATAAAAGTTELLPDGSQPTVAPNSQDTIAQLQAKRKAAMALAASNTQLQPLLPTLLAEIDNQINQVQMSEASTTIDSLDMKSPFELDALRSKYVEQTLSPSKEVRDFASTMLGQIKETRPIAVLNENAREAGFNQIQTIDALITDPDLKIILGVEGAYNKFVKDKGLGFTNPRAADLYSIVDKFKGEAFVTAYQGLKGGGPITDIEGKSATAAQNRVNEATDLPSYLRALAEVRTVVAKRVEKLGGKVPPIPTATSRPEPTIMPNGVIIKPRG